MRSNQQDVREVEQARQVANTHKAEAAVVAVELTDVAVIFLFKQFLLQLLEGLGHSILFPIAAGASVLRAILAIRAAALEKNDNKKKAAIKAVVEVIAALGISIATVGTLFATAAFVLAGPIIFTAVLAVKTLFHLVASVYYGVCALQSRNRQEKQIAMDEMKRNLIIATANALTTIAAGLVFIAHKLSFGLVGVIGASIGAAYAVYKGCSIMVAKVPVNKVGIELEQLAPSPIRPQAKENMYKGLKSDRRELEEIETEVLTWLEDDVPPSPPPLAKQCSQVRGMNTVDILQFTAQCAEIGDRQEMKRIVSQHPKQKKLSHLKQELATGKTQIPQNLRRLERRLKADNAFDRIPRALQETVIKPISTIAWDKLYNGIFPNAAEPIESKGLAVPVKIKALALETNQMIHHYNDLIAENSEILQQDSYEFAISADQSRRRNSEQQEAEDEEFRMRTGLAKEDALQLGHLIGLGSGMSS